MKVNNKKKYLDLLSALKKISQTERDKIVPYLKDEAVEFICECFHNVIYTDLKLKNRKSLGKKLKSSCSVHRLKVISSKNKSLNVKRKALKQEGTGLGLILSAAVHF